MKKTIIISSLATFCITIAFLIFNKKESKLVLKCSGESLNIRLDKEMKESRLITKNNIILYSNGLGTFIQRGEIYLMGNRYIINRVESLTYSYLDKDGLYSITITPRHQRASDNLPKNLSPPYDILGWQSIQLYMNASKINKNTFIFKELGTPVFLCTSS